MVIYDTSICAVCTAALDLDKARDIPGDKSVRTLSRPSFALVPPFTDTTERGENECDENCHVAEEASCKTTKKKKE